MAEKKEEIESGPPIHLPVEVLAKIFSYLEFTDLTKCSLVCKIWCSAAAERSLHKSTIVTFNEDLEFEKGFHSFANAVFTGFDRLRLHGIAITLNDRFASMLPRLSCLGLNGCQVSERDLIAILHRCNRLTKLDLINAKETFIAGTFLHSPETRDAVRVSLANVRELNLANNPYLTDALFNRITSCMPGLKNVSLDNCKIMNHPGIYKKFYTKDEGEEGSPSVFTWRSVLRFVRERAAKLTSLSFVSTGIDGLCVQQLSDADGLDLKRLNLGNNSSITQEAIWDLVKRQRNLESLGLDFCRRVFSDYPATSREIFAEIATIQNLSLAGLSIPKNLDLFLPETKKIRTLNVSNMDTTPRHFVEGLLNSESRDTLQSFTATNFCSSPEHFETLIPHLPRLTHLDISGCQGAITDKVMQAICKHLVLLRVLDIGQCRRVTDLGFTGQMLKNLPDDVMEEAKRDGKIFPGTKAEAELLNEAKVLKAIQKAANEECEETAHAFTEKIDNVKGLRRIRLSMARITNLTFKNSFISLQQLLSIDLSFCDRITAEGFELLGHNNPSLEEVVARQSSLCDSGLLNLIRCTPRLKHLDIEGCKGVTSLSVMQLPSHTVDLRRINLSFCMKVTSHAVDYIRSRLTRLRYCECRGLSIAELLEEEAEYNSVPIPPPLPVVHSGLSGGQ